MKSDLVLIECNLKRHLFLNLLRWRLNSIMAKSADKIQISFQMKLIQCLEKCLNAPFNKDSENKLSSHRGKLKPSGLVLGTSEKKS